MTKKKKISSYRALKGCEIKDRRFEPGDQVPSAAFPADVIENWLAKGVLTEWVDAPKELIEEDE